MNGNHPAYGEHEYGPPEPMNLHEFLEEVDRLRDTLDVSVLTNVREIKIATPGHSPRKVVIVTT